VFFYFLDSLQCSLDSNQHISSFIGRLSAALFYFLDSLQCPLDSDQHISSNLVQIQSMTLVSSI